MSAIAARKLRVYLVEDTVELREEIHFGLTVLGIDVTSFGDAAGLYRAMAAQECDIVVIDIGLPGEDGFMIVENLRSNQSLGLVFLTSRALLEDRLHGLGLGADAYLVKPIDVRELAATLRAIDRRINVTTVTDSKPGWMLDGWVLRNPQGIELVVSETERYFLQIMVAASGQIVEHETLIEAFSKDDGDYDPHRIDSLINRLRKRTEQAGLGNLPLKSVRGMGYVFTK